MAEDKSAIFQKAREEVLGRCYHAIEPEDEVFTRDLCEAMGITDEEFMSFVYDDMAEESLVDNELGGYDAGERGYGICLTARGILDAEELEPADSPVAERHRAARIAVLRMLAEVRQQVGQQGEMSYLEILGRTRSQGFEDKLADRALEVLNSAGHFAEYARHGAYRRISKAGLEYLAEHDAQEALGARLIEIEALEPQRRGKALEAVLADALQMEGCRCETDTGSKGEQIDLVVECGSSFYVCEAKWLKEPVQPCTIDQMIGRLNRRPAAVVGVIFSMSDFTQSARELAAGHATHRTILLLGEEDTRAVIRGEPSFEEIVRSQLRNLVSRGSL